MGDPASTRPSLLIRIRDPGDAEGWRQFVALYGAMIYQFARKQGSPGCRCRRFDPDRAPGCR